MSMPPRRRQFPRPVPAAALAAVAMAGLAPPVQAAATAVVADRAALEARVAAVRQALQAARHDAAAPAPSWLVAQATNWTNWPKWSKWSNWANK